MWLLLLLLLLCWHNSALLTFNNVTYNTCNIFDSGNSFNTDTIQAAIIPVSFDLSTTLCKVLKPIPSTTTSVSVVYLIDWPASAKASACRSYTMAINALRQELQVDRVVPLFYGYTPTMYDAAGPYVFVDNAPDAMAVEPAGARALLSHYASTQSIPVVTIQREPGPWNLLFTSNWFLLTRWVYLALVVLVDVYGLYRLSMLLYQLLKKQQHATRRRRFKSIVNNQFFRIYVLSILLATVGFFTVNERSRSAVHQAFGLFMFVLNQLILCGITYAWARIVHRIRPMRAYSYLSRMALALGIVSVGGFIVILVGISSTTRLAIFNIGLIIVLPGMTILLILMQGILCLLSFGFARHLAMQGISASILKPFQRMRIVFLVMLLALVGVFVGGLLYFIASTVAQYVALVFISRLTIVVLQLCILSIPNSIDMEWQDNVVQASRIYNERPLSSHHKVIDWLNHTQSVEQVELHAH